MPVDRLGAAPLGPAYGRDGVTILDGEPFARPDGLLALVRALRGRGCGHILCDSGFTHEALRRRAARHAATASVVGEIDTPVDGPYASALADGAGPWTGSRDQRVPALKGGGAAPFPAEGVSTPFGGCLSR